MSIEARLCALEAELRVERGRRRFLAFVPLALLLLAASDDPATLRVKRIEVLDAAGAIALAIDAQGLAVHNEEGRAVVQIAADPQGDGYVGVFSRLGFGKTVQPRPSQYIGAKSE